MLNEAFCDFHKIPMTVRYDAWGDLLEPYLDTEFTPENEALTNARLNEHGISTPEIKAIRDRVGSKVMAYNSMVWDWTYLGLGDLYRSHVLIPQEFVDWSSEIARRSWQGPGTPAAKYKPMEYGFGGRFNLDLLPAPSTAFEAILDRNKKIDAVSKFIEASMNGRPYHNTRHIEEALRFGMASLRSRRLLLSRSQKMRALQWAILYHDVIYNAGAKDNEIQSADLAYKTMTELGLRKEALLVRELILWTAHHRRSEVKSPLFRAMWDADMGILGAGPTRYDEYVLAVREEWSTVVTPEQFRTGRAKFLAGLLDPSVLAPDQNFFYGLDPFHSKMAHANIARELSLL